MSLKISAIRQSGESNWRGTPSKTILDEIEKRQDPENSEFFQLLKNAIVEVDRKRNKVWFANPIKGE